MNFHRFATLTFAVVLFILWLWFNPAFAQIPANAHQYLPVLIELQPKVFPESPPSQAGWTAAQVEKESCIHKKHPKCWNPRSELKTKREYGFGFGQTTVAYRADGSERFNVFKELQQLDPVLRKWQWEDRFNPEMQLRALLVKDRICFTRTTGVTIDVEHVAFTLACYNGGFGGVLSDRRLCQGTKGCDHSKWFGHTARTSNKSRVKWEGYGKSAFEINREYPTIILFTLRPSYAPYFKEKS